MERLGRHGGGRAEPAVVRGLATARAPRCTTTRSQPVRPSRAHARRALRAGGLAPRLRSRGPAGSTARTACSPGAHARRGTVPAASAGRRS
ncbi:hypothetical protein QJS66_15050 [Kocuria rhizophila]|nr:hypothetical protein QJS66_15050 [Kocuria rhizophila]